LWKKDLKILDLVIKYILDLITLNISLLLLLSDSFKNL